MPWHIYSIDFPNTFREVKEFETYYQCKQFIKMRARQGRHTASFIISSMDYWAAKRRYHDPEIKKE